MGDGGTPVYFIFIIVQDETPLPHYVTDAIANE